jgi:hypothetical protein
MELIYTIVMLISHESPLCLLDESRYYNDYDYCLVHLCDKYPQYYSFFKASLTMGREVLLDNSIFELKHAFDSKAFAAYVEDLQPTFYVVPDVLEDSYATRSSFDDFVGEYSNLPGLKIGVVQGKSYQDLVECYKFMSDNADYIAISFDYSWYQQVGFSQQKNHKLAQLERMATGREYLINRLIEDDIWNSRKPHHLLGNSLPQEMKAYKHIESIRSVDTSNPIMAGIKGMKYISGIGLLDKPHGLLADHLEVELDQDTFDIIQHNTYEYKQLAK